MPLFIRLALVAIALCTTATKAGWLEPVDEPRPAPALELPDMKGSPVALADFRGSVVLVNFWASWCPPCLIEMPGMERLARKLEGRPFVVLAVNVGESRHKAFRALDMMNFTQTTLLDRDGKAAKEWRVGVYPTSLIVDKEGRIRYEVLGPLEWDGTEATAVIEELVDEPAPDDVAARPVVLGFDHRNQQTTPYR